MESVDSSRIVSLSGDITEILFELGVGNRVVGVDVTTVAPETALSLPVVGVGRFITAEGVLGVEPTLVIADTQSGPQQALSQIEATGVRLEVLEVPTDFDGLYDKVSVLGDLLGEPEAAQALNDRLKTEIDTARSRATPNDIRIAYVYTRGPDVMLLFGEGMTTQPLIEAAGAVDAGADSGVIGTIPVTAEGLIAARPDVIIVPEEGLSILGGVDVLLEVPGIAETPAGSNGAILAYPEGDFLTFGPRIADSVQRLIDDLAATSQ